ncbi:hypothetical protein TNCV_48081 [Trichonephila clavipes]|nr:hypothetical protein TNCV_48081 [Trichonephila clavipes]
MGHLASESSAIFSEGIGKCTIHRILFLPHWTSSSHFSNSQPSGQRIGVYDHTATDKPESSLYALFHAHTISIPCRRRTKATPPGSPRLNQ